MYLFSTISDYSLQLGEHLFTDLYSAEYLYGRGKKTIDKYTTSSVCMFKITNIEAINSDFNRKTGDEVIIRLSNLIKKSISSEYLFIRYMGPKFVIVFSGVDSDGVSDFLVKKMNMLVQNLILLYLHIIKEQD